MRSSAVGSAGELVKLATQARLAALSPVDPRLVCLPEKIMMKKMKPMIRGWVFSCFRTFCVWGMRLLAGGQGASA